jgi:hypothetical protein
MEFWSRETWASWLIDGIRIFNQDKREDRVLAFAPLTLDPDVGEAADLFPQLKAAVSASTMSRFEEGLAMALSAWCGEDGASSASFLILLAGFVEGIGPRIAFKAMLQKPISFHLLPNAAMMADSIAFALSRRGDVGLIRELKPSLEPILSTSRTAAVLVAARESVEDVSDFVPFLANAASDLFKLPASDRDWRFVVNQLVERAGIEKAIEAAYFDRSRNTARLREALILHRISVSHTIERPGFRTVVDRFRNRTYEIPTSSFSKYNPYVAKALAGGRMDPDSPFAAKDLVNALSHHLKHPMSGSVGDLLESDLDDSERDRVYSEEEIVFVRIS